MRLNFHLRAAPTLDVCNKRAPFFGSVDFVVRDWRRLVRKRSERHGVDAATRQT